MPFDIIFKNLPAGFALESTRGPGDVLTSVTEFVSSEDGDRLIGRLDGISEMILSRLPSRIAPSTIDHLLAIIRPDRSATVYVNELNCRVEMQAKRSLAKGEDVYCDDIADIKRMSLHLGDCPVAIPPNAGVLVLFSVGWRKGLYYDLSPLPSAAGSPRESDVEVLLGQFYAQLQFQERLKISGVEFDALLEQRWFPFISLKGKTVRTMVDYVRNGWPVDDMLDSIYEEVSQRLQSQSEKWENNPFFQAHSDLLKTAVERYVARDFVSAASILYPRIEGVLRAYHICQFPDKKASQTALIEAAISQNPTVQHANSLLLPSNFESYVKEVFFAPFDPADPQELSRHTVAHGVAPAADFDMKGATIGFLVLEQLSFYLIPPQAAPEE